MSKSRQDLSLEHFNGRRTNSSATSTSIKINVRHQRVNKPTDFYRMNTSETVPPHLLMQNVRDIRKRLLETEKTLNKISKAENKLENDDDIDDLISVTSTDSRRRGPIGGAENTDTIEDDRESLQSGLATLPDSSYAGFERVQPPSSTPNKPVQAKSRITGLLEMIESQHEESDHSPRDRKHSEIEEDRQDSRAKVRFLKEANKKVLIQNQKLMNEVEKTSYELQGARAKIRELSYELDEFRQCVPDLEDKILGLQAETESQDKALREAEERYESSQRETIQSDRKHKELQQEIEEIRNELYEEKKMRRSLETQRDDAMQNFLEAQDSLEEYQKKTNDRLRKYEESEDHLRDSLSHANREREELIERLSYFQNKVKQQQDNIRHLQSLQEVDEDNKTDIEEQNNELRAQISKLSSKITRLEADTQLMESLKFENSQLQREVNQQQQQLGHCQQEIEESRTMLVQLEQLAQQVQQSYSRPSSRNNSFTVNDSGNFSLRQTTESAASFQKSTNTSDCNTTSAKNILSDLRLKLAMKDAEIERLQTSLKDARESEDQSNLIENLRTDLQNMIEKNQKSAEQCQEFNSMMTKLTSERDKLLSQVKDLRRELADRDSENSSFELRINQRNTQLVELQEQLNDKAHEMSKLERKVREKNSCITDLEEQLHEKTSQCSHQSNKIKQLEAEITTREAEAQSLHKELHEIQGGTTIAVEERERIQKIHKEQCHDYQKQIDILQERVESKSSQAVEWEKQTDILRREISDKNHRLHETELALSRTQQQLEDKTESSQRLLKEFESQARNGTNQIKQLESALNTCKIEITTYIGTLEEMKELHDIEIKQRDDKIAHLTKETKVKGHELEVKSQECEQLEKVVVESQSMLQVGTVRIHELEEYQAQLQEQICNLEHQLLSGNSQWMSDQQTMETKLKQACEDLEQRTTQINELTSTLKKVEEERRKLMTEVNLLDDQLHDEQDQNEIKTERISKLEKDLRDIRVQLEQKIELVTDFEDQLLQKNSDMEQQLHLVSDLDIEIKKLQDIRQDSLEQISDLEKKYDKVLYEKKTRDEMITDMKDTLADMQEELSCKKEEVEKLKLLLEERQEELDDRVSLVTQLDKTMKEQHEEMEQRIKKLDSNLQRQEVEVKERTIQISELDNRLHETQSQLREKTLQHQQAEQISQKQQVDLTTKTVKLQELETLVERQKVKIDEQKHENVEITQELRLTREQLQQQHTDFMATRRELAHANREHEKLTREVEELRNILQSQEGDTARLAEELGAAKVREKDVQSQKEAELQKLVSDNDDLEQRYQSELSSLREEIGDYREANDVLKAQLKEKSKQLNEMENHYADQVQIAAEELGSIHEEMESRKLQMDASNEQIILKDAEIARLKAKISGLERTISAMRLSESFNLSQYNSGNRDSDIGLKGSGDKDIILTDVSVTLPVNSKYSTRHMEFGQEVEIQFSSGGENNNCDNEKRQNIESENIVPSGPVRILNFGENDNKSSESLGLTKPHRPKPVLPNVAYKHSSDPTLSKESKNAEKQQKQSAFARVVKSKNQKDEKTYPGETELEPVTAMRMYNIDSFDVESSDIDPQQCMKELQERLRANELRQQDIDRQLEHLEHDNVT